MTKFLIINADDFGQDSGINQGILECHTHGVVSSASLMVTGHAVSEAVSMGRDHPQLSLGLHWDVWGEDEREFDTSNTGAVKDEIRRQLEDFERIVGRLPTHIDSHRHAHREPHLMPIFKELVEPLGIPLRYDGRVRFVGGFYAQWEWRVTNLHYVSVPFLERMLREEVPDGWTEVSCHPGYIRPGYTAVYTYEREEEVRTLTDPRIRAALKDLGVRLCSYEDYSRSLGRGASQAANAAALNSNSFAQPSEVTEGTCKQEDNTS